MMRRRIDLPPTPPQPWSEMIPAASFYARLAKWRDVLVDDEDEQPDHSAEGSLSSTTFVNYSG
jgi:hypothetical protein